MDEKTVESLREITEFLNLDTRVDLKDATIEHLLGECKT